MRRPVEPRLRERVEVDLVGSHVSSSLLTLIVEVEGVLSRFNGTVAGRLRTFPCGLEIWQCAECEPSQRQDFPEFLSPTKPLPLQIPRLDEKLRSPHITAAEHGRKPSSIACNPALSVSNASPMSVRQDSTENDRADNLLSLQHLIGLWNPDARHQRAPGTAFRSLAFLPSMRRSPARLCRRFVLCGVVRTVQAAMTGTGNAPFG